MNKKTWIKVKRGLLDKEHRERLGIRVWLYLHMLDYTEWETGKIAGWTDAEHAALLEMPHRTLQEQRQRLAEDGYISCAHAFQSITITIHNWTNPRLYSDEIINSTGSSVPPYYGEFRTHSTGSSVPIQSESSVPLLYSPHINHIKESQVKRVRAAKPAAPPEPTPKAPSAQQLMFQALADVTLMDMKLNAGRLGKAATALLKAEYTPEQVTALYLPGGLWYTRDWRGQRGDPPKPEQVGETIKALMSPEYQDAPRTNGHRQTVFERNMAGLNEIIKEMSNE